MGNKLFRSCGKYSFPGFSISTPYDFKCKEENISNYIMYMLSRTQSMFEYEGLPDSIPARMLELYLQVNGFVCIAKHGGELWALYGGLGGEPDPYYMPTICTVANPALRWDANLEIGKECVVFPSDSMYLGLIPMFSKYATLLAENDLTIRIADINSRIYSLLSAPDDRTRKAGEEYLRKVENGDLGVLAETAFLDGIRVQPYAGTGASSSITQLIELQQYLKAGWFNDLGLEANYNMKRESINSNEAQLNKDALLPLIDDMLSQREKGLEAVNAMFGTSISVKLASSWKVTNEEVTNPETGEDVISGRLETEEGEPDDSAT